MNVRCPVEVDPGYVEDLHLLLLTGQLPAAAAAAGQEPTRQAAAAAKAAAAAMTPTQPAWRERDERGPMVNGSCDPGQAAVVGGSRPLDAQAVAQGRCAWRGESLPGQDGDR